MNYTKKFFIVLCPSLLLSVMPIQSGGIVSKSGPYVFSSVMASVCLWAVINQNEKVEKQARKIIELQDFKEKVETDNAARKNEFDQVNKNVDQVNRKIEKEKLRVNALETTVMKTENALKDYDLSGHVTKSEFKQAFEIRNISFTDPAQELAALAFAIRTFSPKVEDLPAKLNALSLTAESAKQQTINHVGDLERIRSSIESLQATTSDLSSSFVEIKKHEQVLLSSSIEQKTEKKIENSN